MNTQSDWWEKLLAGHREDGAENAEHGVFDPPYPCSCDPTDQDENYAYELGWKRRRKELGTRFKWA